MNIDAIVSRLQKVNNQLMTISSLRRIQDMSEKRAKPCSCAHHRSTSVSRLAGKCSSNAREKKKCRCFCRTRPKLCSCANTTDDQATTDHRSKETEITDDSKWQSDKSSRHEKPEQVIQDESLRKYELTKKFTDHEKPKEINPEESSQKRESAKKFLNHEKSKETPEDGNSFKKIESTEKFSHREKPREINPEESFQKRESTKKFLNHEKLKETPEVSFQKSDESADKSSYREKSRETIPRGFIERHELGKKLSHHEKSEETPEDQSLADNQPNKGLSHRERSKETPNDESLRRNELTKGSSSRREDSREIARGESFESAESREKLARHERSREIIRDESFANNDSGEKSFYREKPKKISSDGSLEKTLPEIIKWTNDDRCISNPPGNKSYDKPEKNHASTAAATTLTASRTKNLARETFTLEMPNENKTTSMEKIYKELAKRNLELEEKLKNMNCSMSCLRDEGESRAACLIDALERAKKEAKLASRTKSLALNLAKQSRDQTEAVKASRDEIVDRINVVKSDNTKLRCECDELRCKLKEITDNEEKRFAEVDDKVNRMQSAVKQKEMALTSEKSELEKSIGELTNHARVQKKRICDLTSLCAKQRDLIRENENCITAKNAQLSEAEDKLQSAGCRCRQMQEQIDVLGCRLNEETIARENLQKIFDERRDNYDCELQIKSKIIGDQVETIKKLKKLLQDSERMAHQAACEFETLRDELHCLKQSNKSLRIALDEVDERTSDDNEFCDRCNILEGRMKNLANEKEKAMSAAKLAAAKLCKTAAEYERQLDCEKRQNDYVNNLVDRQEAEIKLLKKEILCVKEFRSRRSNDYIDQQ